ncbi:MAG TPA: hypothetical protein VF142_16335 [Longimicrobium sp.]
MTRDEYEAHRRRLGEELRVAVELAEEGYRARVRALDLAWQESAPGAPVPSLEPPARSRSQRRPGELYAAVLGLLPQLPELFTKDDLAPLFTDPPNRASLFRALQELTRDGVLRQERRGQGRLATTYRQKPRTQST